MQHTQHTSFRFRMTLHAIPLLYLLGKHLLTVLSSILYQQKSLIISSSPVISPIIKRKDCPELVAVNLATRYVTVSYFF